MEDIREKEKMIVENIVGNNIVNHKNIAGEKHWGKHTFKRLSAKKQWEKHCHWIQQGDRICKEDIIDFGGVEEKNNIEGKNIVGDVEVEGENIVSIDINGNNIVFGVR